MRIKLVGAQTIKSKDYDPGDEVIVSKDVGERMIEEGLANRVIEETENRIRGIPESQTTTYRAHRFAGHKKIFRGSDGKNYHADGDGYVEVKE